MTFSASGLRAAAIAAALWTSAGCRPKAQSHETRGVVREIRSEGRTLVIEHEEFPGFMEAMTMPFDVADPKLSAGLATGDRVQFTITREADAWPVTKLSKL